MKGYFLFFLIIIFKSPQAQAFESLPEFQSLTESEVAIFEGPNRLTPEYQSDILSYLKPDSYEYEWLSHRIALDGTAGSTGAKHFMVDHRAKVHADFTDELEFRFHYTQEGNQERDGTHHIFELIGWPKNWVGLSFYGEATLYKREDDTGLALLFKPGPHQELRFFNTFVDVARLRRNDRPDSFDSSHLPYSRGVVWRWWADPTQGNDFVEIAARYEPKTIWIFPVEKFDYTYWKMFGSFWVRKKINEQLSLGLRVQWDNKFEGKTPQAGGTLLPESWKTSRLFIRVESEMRDPFKELPWIREWTTGLYFGKRSWKTSGGDADYQDVLPYFWLKIPAYTRAQREDLLGIGYQLTWHESAGPSALFHEAEEKRNTLQNRLNLTYDFRFKTNLSLRLLASADLDELGNRHSWEGGNVMLNASF